MLPEGRQTKQTLTYLLRTRHIFREFRDLLNIENYVSNLKGCSYCKWRKRSTVDIKGLFPQEKMLGVDIHHRTLCSALLLTNLAQPYWVSVECSLKLRSAFFCQVEKFVHSREANITVAPSDKVCSQESLVINNMCQTFLWCQKTAALHFSMTKEISDPTILEKVLLAVSFPFPRFFSHNVTHFQSNTRCSNTLKFALSAVLDDSEFGLLLVNDHKKMVFVGKTVFTCNNNESISVLWICDGNKDCPDNIDEDDCFCPHDINYSKKCKYITPDTQTNFSCSHFYLMGNNGNCYIPDFRNSFRIEETCSEIDNITECWNGQAFFLCENGDRIPVDLVFDLVTDCDDGSDELGFEIMNNSFTCRSNGQLSCREGHTKCFNISAICIFKLNQYGRLTPCRNGEHLQNCKLFECNTKFKCPGYYCIPWVYICDEKWDCPNGYDESSVFNCGSDRQCSGFFKCRNSHLCINLEDVCDEERQCPYKDDESFCALHGALCTADCQCLLYSMRCYQTTIAEDSPLKYMKVSILKSTIWMPQTLFKNAVLLSMISCSIVSICSVVKNVKDIEVLDVHSNEIVEIEQGCFSKSHHIKMIRLDQNQISHIHSAPFPKNTSLAFLNLTDNQLTAVSRATFACASVILGLHLINNKMTDVDSSTLQGIQIIFVKADQGFCCVAAPHSMCSVESPNQSLCTLLPSIKSQTCLSNLAGLVLFLDTVSVILQVVSFRKGLEKSGGPGATVAFINMADLFCVFPLLSLVSVGQKYGSHFVLEKTAWKSGFFCHFIFAAISAFVLLSPLALLFLGVSRLLIVIHPLDTRVKEAKFVRYVFLAIFTLSVTLSIMLTLMVWIFNAGMPVLCLPFLNCNNFLFSTIFSFLITILQLVTLVCSIILYIKMILALKQSQDKVKDSVSKQSSNKFMILQICVSLLCSLICWIPSSAIFLVFNFMERCSENFVVWVLATIVPINSIVHPLIFCFVTCRKILTSKTMNKKQRF